MYSSLRQSPSQNQPLPAASDRIIQLFDTLFLSTHNTCLVSGNNEPEYIPSPDGQQPSRILFSHDYCSSALHEIAHWCLAGEQRRLCHDYGYWYSPDGRTQCQQQQFEQVEIKPQALEWLFSMACGVTFRVSADNLQAGMGASAEFKAGIYQQAHDYCHQGINGQLNHRASQWIKVLSEYYGVEHVFNREHYRLECL